MKLCIKSYLSGGSADCLKSLGFLSDGEPTSRGYVLYKALKHGVDVVSLAKFLHWREFEEFIRYVFSEVGFGVVSNLRMNCGGEFDVVAWSRRIAFVIEAKKWRGGNLRKVATSHLEKVRKCLPQLFAFSRCVAPLVVNSTGVNTISNGVPIVSVEKLGSFLTSFHYFEDQIAVFCQTSTTDVGI